MKICKLMETIKQRSSVRIVVAGEAKTGKSSLILTAATQNFPLKNVPSVLPPTRLSGIPITAIDTDSKNRKKLAEELKRAEAVVLTYASYNLETLERLITFWLPELRRLEIKVPVILVGCKIDRLQGQFRLSYDQMMSPIMQHFPEIETCVECSSSNLFQTVEVFRLALEAVLHPRAPLVANDDLTPGLVTALTRIFDLCDSDEDGFLNDDELDEFLNKCFDDFQTDDLKAAVLIRSEEGVCEDGLTLEGFILLHAIFIENNRLDMTWTVLRAFGYDDDLKLATHEVSNETEEHDCTRKRSRNHRLLTFASVGAAVAVAGLGAYRIYAARKSSGD